MRYNLCLVPCMTSVTSIMKSEKAVPDTQKIYFEKVPATTQSDGQVSFQVLVVPSKRKVITSYKINLKDMSEVQYVNDIAKARLI